MERFQRRTRASSPAIRVATIVDRRFDDRIVKIDWKGKQHNLPTSASNPTSCSNNRAFNEENLVKLDQERSCLRSVSGTPMKKLLADEMLKGNESRRRSPSIIARLMGLDGLPAQQTTSKQNKRSCDNHQQNGGSAGSRKSSKLYDSRTRKKDTRGHHLFKDVYEVIKNPEKESRIHMSHAAFSPNPSEDEIAFVRQKFMDVKRCSTDEKLQNSKQFYDALEVLDSNKDLLLKFLQEPNSLFAKHLHDLRGVPESQCEHVLSIKNANNLKCNIDAIGSHSGGEASRKIDISHFQKHWDSGYSDVPHRRNTDSHKLDFLAEDKEDITSAPTRIVVLKPNVGKVHNTSRSVSSPSPSHGSISDLDLRNECPNRMRSGSELRGKRNIHKDLDIYGCKYQESRELAREIARRMKSKLGTDSFNVSSSGHKGYCADESSREDSENESSYGSEVTIANSRTSCSRSIRNRASTPNDEESSVNKEAKRRLSERWKMTCRSQEVGASGRGSTLAEMLAIPDMDVRPRNLDDIIAQDEYIHRSRRKEGAAELMCPFGISSRDGWKDGCIQNLSRSRSLPSSSSHLLTPKSSTRRETLATESFFVTKESIDHGRSKALKRESKVNEGSFAKNLRASSKKSELSYPVSMEMIDDIQEVQFSRNMRRNGFDSKDSPELKSVILEVSSDRHDSDLATNPVKDEEYEIVSKSMNCSELIPPPHRSSDTPSQDSSCEMQSVEQEPSTNYGVGSSSSSQCAATQPESPASSKESEQPSPVSVLEPAYVEDISSGSECFERVSAELHGLRMQLKLLKLESEASEAYDEGSMVISSDEDGEESTESHDPKGFVGAGDSWASSYLFDILTESGIDELDPNLFIATWHSPGFPIGSWVFENIERKYSDRDACSKSQRKQLFDCINFRIIEISQQFVDLHPWVNSVLTHILPRWWKNELRTELHKLLDVHEKKATEVASDVEILVGMRWMDLGDHVDAIGRDIEVLLIDDLVAELTI